MRKIKRKKYYIVFLSLVLLSLFFANYRYPFFYNINGPWKFGYNKASNFNKDLIINQKNVFSINNLTDKGNSVFLADPFFIFRNDTIFVFVENQIKDDNANIDLFLLIDTLMIHKGTILDPPYHTSYPQVFSYQSKYYMLPESKRANNLILYKSDKFPYNWSISDTLIKNVRIKDATLMINDQLNILITCNDNLELLMYCSNSLFDGWEECNNYKKYFGNEVRPAGRIINIGGKNFIPMQNLSHGYGTSVSLYEIIITDDFIDLKRSRKKFLKPQIGEKSFNSSMHHIDIQKINDEFIYFYDGQSLNKKAFSLKRSIKYNILDLKSFFYTLIFKIKNNK